MQYTTTVNTTKLLMLAVCSFRVHARFIMAKYNKDIVRLFHLVKDDGAVANMQLELRQTYGYSFEALSSSQEYAVTILGRAAVRQANSSPAGKQVSHEKIAESLRAALAFDETSTDTAVVDTLYVWRTTNAKPHMVGVELYTEHLEDEFFAAKKAIDELLGTPADWPMPTYELGLGWLQDETIAAEIDGTPLGSSYAFELDRLQITPRKFDPLSSHE